MRTSREGRTPIFGPVAIAILGVIFVGVGAAVKTGYVRIGRGSTAVDSSNVTVRTGAGDVVMPARDSTPTRRAAPPTPPELVADTITPPNAAKDSSAVQPTADELAGLASSLIVPVAGVQPKDLLDTFEEPRGSRRHNALAIPAARGSPVLSAADGRLQQLYTSDAGGLMVYASDPTDRFILMYAHLDRYAEGLTDGMPLRRGDTIGYVGTTGNAPPNVPHLHFAVARTNNVRQWWTGMPVDPRPLLQR